MNVTSEPDRGAPSSRFPDTFAYADVSALDGQQLTPRVVRSQDAPSRARQFVRAGDTVLSGVRVYLRNAALIPDDGPDVVSTAFCVIRPSEGLDPRYVFRWISSDQFISKLIPLQRGNSPPAVLDADVREQLIPVPPPEVQCQLLARIDELFTEIGEGERAIAAVRVGLATYQRALVRAAVTGDLTREWRQAHQDVGSGADLLKSLRQQHSDLHAGRNGRRCAWPGGPEVLGLPTLPPSWQWASLSQLGDFGRGKSKHRPRNDPRLYGGPYPFVQTGRVAEGSGTIERFDQTYSELGLAQSKLWPAGTLCITIAANIAKTGVLAFDACFPDSVVGLTCFEGVRPEYVELFIRSIQQELELFAPATAQKNINLETLNGLAVPLPPTEEQDAIIALARMDTGLHDVAGSDLDDAPEQLRQSILAAAFRGDLVA